MLTEDCCTSSIQLKAKKLQLSSDTVACISNDLHDQFLNESRDLVLFTLIALDSTKGITDMKPLAVFIRRVMPDFKSYEEILILCSFHRSTKRIDMFREFRAILLEVHLDPSSSFQWQRMGVLSWLERIKVFKNSSTNGVKKKSCHCVMPPLHCAPEKYCAKPLKMSNVTEIVISTVNWIRAHALSHSKFKKFLACVDPDYGDVVMFNAMQWLSRANRLRFYALFPEIKTFIAENKSIPQLSNEE